MKSLFVLIVVGLAGCASVGVTPADPAPRATSNSTPTPSIERTNTMELGAFSVSLAVKDMSASRAFYEKLGFAQVGGDPAQNWLILRNGATTIGLFQGMFPNNIMTFNPGWSPTCETLDAFQDVRELQSALQAQGIEMDPAADPDGTGPASFVITDPDGNAILLDQHVPRPTK